MEPLREPLREQLRVTDIMSRKVIVLSEEDNLSQITAGLDHFRFHHLPVVDGPKLVGMLSQRDMLRNTVTGVDHGAIARTREERYLEKTFVRDVMQSEVLTIGEDELVSVAAERMLTARVGALPVVGDANQLLGIVTENDIVRLVARRGLLNVG
jgi:acetoin utilization protein AcuB